MGTTADKLQKVLTSKESIRQAIINKGVNVSPTDTFSTYASKISEIQGVIQNVDFYSIEELKNDWKYYLVSSIATTDIPDTSYAKKTYDDSSWSNISVPHDWSIYNNFNSSSAAGYEGGYLDGGQSWYRKKLTSLTDNAKRVFIYFDGIYKDSYVYVNGSLVGQNKWYNPFYFDITSKLNFDGNDVLAVYVRNRQPSSRWYSGSGIIRNVYLLTGSTAILGINDIDISSPNLENDLVSGIVDTNIKINANNSGSEQLVLLKHTIKYKGKIINTVSESLTLPTGDLTIEKTIQIPNPELWDEYQGNLYEYTLEVSISNTIVYSKSVNYGYRYFKFDKDKGFFLNGRNLKLKGVCLHHDLGCIGAEVNKSGIERQIRLLKEMGCNAVRITHNPASSEMLDVCANEGILVVEELFDCWTNSKKQYDFSTDFNNYYETVINTTVNRGKNNPSIIMYSIGNEIIRIPTLTKEQAVTIATNLRDCIKAIDTERLVTMGDDTPANTTSLAVMDIIDVIGINYGNDAEYSNLRVAKPDKPVYGSETTSALSSRGVYARDNVNYQCSSFDDDYVDWGDPASIALKRHMESEYLAGMFIWTGFDYIGEPTPFNTYPTKSSYFGIIDLAGFPKDIYYMYQSRWTEKPMIHILPHWTHSENDTIKVWLYSNCYKVELFLNGTSKGSKLQSQIGSKYEFEYSISYSEGTLVANGYDENDNLIAQDVIYTSYEPKHIILNSDKSIINKNSDDLLFIECSICDLNKNIVNSADNEITFTVTGGTILGTDNGNPASVEKMRNNVRKAFNGKCLCVVKHDNIEGDIVITATSNGLINGTISIPKSNITAINHSKNKFIDATNPPIYSKENIPIVGISFPKAIINLNVSNEQEIVINYDPTNTTEKGVTYEIGDNSIVKIVNNKLVALKEGTTTLTAKSNYDESVTAQCSIVVSKVEVSNISLNSSNITIEQGSMFTLIATVEPDNATDKSLIWSVDNENCTVNNGVVTANSIGSSIITVTSRSNSSVSAQCNVTVIDNIRLYDTILLDGTKSYTLKSTSNGINKYETIIGTNSNYIYQRETTSLPYIIDVDNNYVVVPFSTINSSPTDKNISSNMFGGNIYVTFTVSTTDLGSSTIEDYLTTNPIEIYIPSATMASPDEEGYIYINGSGPSKLNTWWGSNTDYKIVEFQLQSGDTIDNMVGTNDFPYLFINDFKQTPSKSISYSIYNSVYYIHIGIPVSELNIDSLTGTIIYFMNNPIKVKVK